jgi:hypothetical protein
MLFQSIYSAVQYTLERALRKSTREVPSILQCCHQNYVHGPSATLCAEDTHTKRRIFLALVVGITRYLCKAHMVLLRIFCGNWKIKGLSH